MHGRGGGMCDRRDVHGDRGVCMAGGHAWWGACVAGVGSVWQERWPLQRTVRILLECILVYICFAVYYEFGVKILYFLVGEAMLDQTISEVFF